MFRIVRFRQEQDGNIDLYKTDLSCNLVEAGYKLIRVSHKFGVTQHFHYRIEDTTKNKLNGKPLVYFYADTTKYPIQYNHLLSDGHSFSKLMDEYNFIQYLNKLKHNVSSRKISVEPDIKPEPPQWYKFKFPEMYNTED
jgi:hypothetical protein